MQKKNRDNLIFTILFLILLSIFVNADSVTGATSYDDDGNIITTVNTTIQNKDSIKKEETKDNNLNNDKTTNDKPTNSDKKNDDTKKPDSITGATEYPDDDSKPYKQKEIETTTTTTTTTLSKETTATTTPKPDAITGATDYDMLENLVEETTTTTSSTTATTTTTLPEITTTYLASTSSSTTSSTTTTTTLSETTTTYLASTSSTTTTTTTTTIAATTSSTTTTTTTLVVKDTTTTTQKVPSTTTTTIERVLTDEAVIDRESKTSIIIFEDENTNIIPSLNYSNKKETSNNDDLKPLDLLPKDVRQFYQSEPKKVYQDGVVRPSNLFINSDVGEEPFNKAIALFRSNQIKNAKINFEKLIHYNYRVKESLFYLSQCYYMERDYIKTINHLKYCVELEKGDDFSKATFLFYIGIAYYEMKDFANAITNFETSYNYNKNMIKNLYYLGLSYYQIGDIDKTLYYWKLGADNDNEDCKVNLEWLRKRQISE